MLKKSSTIVTVVSVITIMVFATCKKYPEDPLAFRTVKARLEAEWQIEKIEINGSDATKLYNDSLAPLTLNNFYFWFVYNKLAPNPNIDETSDLFLINKSSKSYKNAFYNNDVAIGNFSYDKKKAHISMGTGRGDVIKDSGSTNIFNKLFSVYTYKESNYIKSLYHKTFIIQKERTNNIYRIYFKRTQR